jgi:excisionase family DNA binding protein
MPAIIKHHISFASKSAAADALLQPGELTTAEAAALAGVSTERIRQLIKSHRIGRWVPRLRLFAVDSAKLAEHLARRKKR